jgi:hypothetical protein
MWVDVYESSSVRDDLLDGCGSGVLGERRLQLLFEGTLHSIDTNPARVIRFFAGALPLNLLSQSLECRYLSPKPRELEL